MNPFDFVININSKSPNLMRNSENDVLAEKGYTPFLTNRSLSYHYDTVLVANMVNQWSHIDKRPQYEFYKATVRPKRRFGKWSKPETSEIINTLSEMYSCSITTAESYAALLTEDQKTELINKNNKGGR